jgi:hypothetical protein
MKPSSGGKTPIENGHLKKTAVLSAFKNCANVTRACEIADIARATFYGWLKEDPGFKASYEAAREEAVQVLEDEAIKRATIGGSDTLLIFLLKAARPQKYRDYVRQEISGPNGGQVVHKFILEPVNVPRPADQS